MGWASASSCFCSGEQPGFFYRQRRLFDFVSFQPAIGQARRCVAADIRELALGVSAATHGRKGLSPEKEQNFLYHPLVLKYFW